jgi:hypothetical protein
MFRYEGDEGLSGPKTRTVLGILGGVALGSMIPKMVTYFTAQGMPADQAKATTDAVVKGLIPVPPAIESEAARLAELERLKRLEGPSMPTWIWPVGMGVIAIAFMGGKMFKRNPPRRRRTTGKRRRARTSGARRRKIRR